MLTESWVEGKRCTTNRENRSLVRIVKQNRFKNLGEIHKEWTEAGVKAPRGVRGVLPGLRRRRTGLLPSGPKSSSGESKFCISFGNQGPRVWRKGGEAHRPSCLKSSVKFPQSVMIWGAMSSAGVGPLCFLKTKVTAPVYQEIFEHFMLPSADQLFKDADLIFQQDLAPVHTAKSTKSWLNDHGVTVLDWPANSPDLNPLSSLSRGKWETRDQKMQMSWRPLSKKSWASIPPQQCHKLITSCHAEGSNWGSN